MKQFQKNRKSPQTVAIIGLGYVGLPLAVAFAKAGIRTIGLDVDAQKVNALKKKESYIPDILTSDVAEVVSANRFIPSTDFSKLKSADAIVICVPTPLRKTKDPDISYIASASTEVMKYLHRGQLVVLESTTYPGTTKEFVLPLLEKTGLRVGKDFYLAFSPERIDPGNQKFQLSNTPKVVGGITSACTRRAIELYEKVVHQVVEVSSTESAEMVKLLENTFRAVNIGLVNEIALICNKLKLNVWEVIEAAATKPYGFMPFYPGPGLGGHCIPVDPHYLSWKMKALNFSARFIELAGEVNSHMPEFVVQKTIHLLNEQKKSVKGAKILLLGMTYKPNVSDLRESPSLDVYQLLRDEGAKIAYHDPYVPRIDSEAISAKSVRLTPASLSSYDVVILLTAHASYDADFLLRHAKCLFDTRNITRGKKNKNLSRL